MHAVDAFLSAVKNGHEWVRMDASSHDNASYSIMHMHDRDVCWDTGNKPATLPSLIFGLFYIVQRWLSDS